MPPGFDSEVSRTADALAFGVVYGLAWPAPDSNPISSGFGARTDPMLGARAIHTGVDLPMPVDSPVRATGPGVVRRASEDGMNGRVLIVDHGRGVTTAYCHNDRLLVRAGEDIRRGEEVALSGNTGRSTGPHLHYQIEIGGHPVDPLAFRPTRARTQLAGAGGP
jgi:murein DD-endopeptidase MepM/ murein hydrolase activator NlpD